MPGVLSPRSSIAAALNSSFSALHKDRTANYYRLSVRGAGQKSIYGKSILLHINIGSDGVIAQPSFLSLCDEAKSKKIFTEQQY